jgi:hypothetical protein
MFWAAIIRGRGILGGVAETEKQVVGWTGGAGGTVGFRVGGFLFSFDLTER